MKNLMKQIFLPKTSILSIIILAAPFTTLFSSAQCAASITASINFVSSNGNGTCNYTVSYRVSGLSTNYKAFQIFSSCNNAIITPCTTLPNGTTNFSGTTNQFTCVCNSATSFTFTFGTSNGNCGGGQACSQIVSLSVLPLQLTSFTGAPKKFYNQLQWQTANEVNTREFVVERSRDDSSFSPIATIAAKGGGDNNYIYNDADKFTGKAYYRLKSIDNDGRYSYSNIIWLSNDGASSITVYPNPAKDIISINGAETGTQAELTNINGTVLQIINITQPVFTIDISEYRSGVYILKLKNRAVQKIIKQ